MAFTRTNWNDVIQHINGIIASNGLPAAPLPEAPSEHRWSQSDVLVARDKLSEISSVPLSFVAPLIKWNQDIIDELMQPITVIPSGGYYIQIYHVHGSGFVQPPAWSGGSEYPTWWSSFTYGGSNAVLRTAAQAASKIQQLTTGVSPEYPPYAIGIKLSAGSWEFLVTGFDEYKSALNGGTQYRLYGWDTYMLTTYQGSIRPPASGNF